MEITWRVISGGGRGEWGEKVQGIRSINSRYKIDRRRLRIVYKMEETKNMDQIKEQFKNPEKELSDEGIGNLSDAQFKTLVIRMLTEMVEYGHKIEEEVKTMQNEIKKNIQGS